MKRIKQDARVPKALVVSGRSAGPAAAAAALGYNLGKGPGQSEGGAAFEPDGTLVVTVVDATDPDGIVQYVHDVEED